MFFQKKEEARLPVLVFHRCSHCEHQNVSIQSIEGISVPNNEPDQYRLLKYNDIVTGYTPPTVKEKIADIREPKNIIKYAKLCLNGSCRKCGNVESWGKFHKSPILEGLIRTAGACGVIMTSFQILSFFSAHSGASPDPFSMLAPLFASLFLVFVLGSIYLLPRGILLLKIKRTDPKYLPKIAMCLEDAEKIAKELGVRLDQTGAAEKAPEERSATDRFLAAAEKEK